MTTATIQHPFWTLLLLAAFLAGATACGQAMQNLRKEQVGRRFYVTLPLTGGNGSEWRWEKHPSFRVRTLSSDEAKALGIGTHTPGGASAQVDEVVGTAPGRFMLHWSLLLHPWATERDVIGRYDLTVVVKSQR
jgi:hypothetical protein